MTTAALIIANGQVPSASVVQPLLASVRAVICADGGANAARELAIRPDVIVGDLDSVLPATLSHFDGVPVHLDRDLEMTDLEKAILWALAKGYDDLVVVGALGKRLDHTAGNLAVFPKFHRRARIRFVDDQGELSYIDREVRFAAAPGDVVSLVPIVRCEGVTTEGLRHALDGEVLALGTREGTSNVATASEVRVRVESGHLLLYRVLRPADR
jgi:thiamine pyrophosphokinase